MKVAIYARVSDKKLKTDGERRQDIERQVQRLLPITGNQVLIFRDDGQSAFKEDVQARPAFKDLMRHIKLNQVKQVYVESLDRWSRRITEGLHTLQDADRFGCTVTSIQEGEIDVTSAPGWLRTGIALLMAEWASRDKSDKIKSAMERRRQDGRKMCRSCKTVHLGRHPIVCDCLQCRIKRNAK